MITQDGFTFTGPAGVIVEQAPPEPQLVRGEFFGVLGESHIVSETFGLRLSCEYRFQGYTTITALRAAVNSVNSKINKLTGEVGQTLSGTGGGTQPFPASTFLGFQPSGPPFFDGSGCNGWVLEGTLNWQQRSRI